MGRELVLVFASKDCEDRRGETPDLCKHGTDPDVMKIRTRDGLHTCQCRLKQSLRHYLLLLGYLTSMETCEQQASPISAWLESKTALRSFDQLVDFESP